MASPLYHPRPRPPGIYRAARALRRASALALVLIIVFVGIVAYSAVQVVKTRPSVGSSTVALESNDTIGITTSFHLTNPGMFTIQQFALHFRVLNGTEALLLDSTAGPVDIASGSNESLPVALYIPMTAAGMSLLTQSQSLDWNVWGNASYAYLFSVSVDISTQKAWGAPFDNLTATVGAPEMVNGSESVPVTIAFSDDASFADAGALEYQVVPPTGPDCAQGAFSMNVPPDSPYSNTQYAALASGCNPSGGQVDSEFVGSGFGVSLPPEAIP
ncbi:MAG: hypothetical protein WB873_07010 [Thermoplasmata archaeon]